MEKHVTKQSITIGFSLAVIVFVLISFFAYKWILLIPKTTSYQQAKTRISPTAEEQSADHIWYNGRNGVNALDLLKERVPLQQDASGLVISINNRAADTANHEYWAFYVNGKLSNVGPQQYVSKDSDKLEWRISKY